MTCAEFYSLAPTPVQSHMPLTFPHPISKPGHVCVVYVCVCARTHTHVYWILFDFSLILCKNILKTQLKCCIMYRTIFSTCIF